MALANLDVFESEGLVEPVLPARASSAPLLESLADLPIVGEIRGMGYFYGIELVKDPVTRDVRRRRVRAAAARRAHARLFDNGLICRADDRGDPVIQLSPPLVAGPDQFDEIVSAIRDALAMKDAVTTQTAAPSGTPEAAPMSLRVGVPTEIKVDEFRVALTPEGVRELNMHGIDVLVQAGAGAGSSLSDEAYRRAGAEIVDSPADVWARRPRLQGEGAASSEFGFFRDDPRVFTYLHLAAYPGVAEALLAAGTTGIAYETVQLDNGALPCSRP